MVAQVPFPEAGRGVTPASTQFPESDFLFGWMPMSELGPRAPDKPIRR